MNVRFSHTNCAHENSKVARNACRRKLAKARMMIVNATDALVNGPKMLTAGESIMPAVEMITVVEEITRETWRSFKNAPVVVMTADDEATTRGLITGWSAKLVQIKTDEKTVRIPAENVVTVVTG